MAWNSINFIQLQNPFMYLSCTDAWPKIFRNWRQLFMLTDALAPKYADPIIYHNTDYNHDVSKLCWSVSWMVFISWHIANWFNSFY